MIYLFDVMVLLVLGLVIVLIVVFEGCCFDFLFLGFSDVVWFLENVWLDFEDVIEDFNESYEDVFELVESIKGFLFLLNEKMIVMNIMVEMMLLY